MQYLLLIYGPESESDDFSPRPCRPMDAFWTHVTERGALKAGEALHPASVGHHGASPGRPDGHDRRPVRRDEGDPRRLLRRRSRPTWTKPSGMPP